MEFDLWKGESDVQDLIPEMVDYMKEGGYAYISEDALADDGRTKVPYMKGLCYIGSAVIYHNLFGPVRHLKAEFRLYSHSLNHLKEKLLRQFQVQKTRCNGRCLLKHPAVRQFDKMFTGSGQKGDKVEMKKILEVLSEEMGKAFEAAGYSYPAVSALSRII